MIIDLPAVLLLFKQFALGEYLQMFETVGRAVSKFAAMTPAVMDCEATNSKYCPSCWVGYGLEYISS
jgi:hypothetical protein